MSINAINSVTSASSIDWGNLTAKKILQYQQLGVDVPTPYLNWAQSFINNITSGDQDETTYNECMSASASKKYDGTQLKYVYTKRTEEMAALMKELNTTNKNAVKAETTSDKELSQNLSDSASKVEDQGNHLNDMATNATMYKDKKQAHQLRKKVGQEGLRVIANGVSSFENSNNILEIYKNEEQRFRKFAESIGDDDFKKSVSATQKDITTGIKDLEEYISDTSGYKNDISEATGVYQSATENSSSSSSNKSTSSNSNSSGSSKSSSTKTKSTTSTTKNTDSTTKSTSTSDKNGNLKTAILDTSPNDKVTSTKEDDKIQADKVIKEKKQEDKKEIKAAQNDGTDKDDKLHTDLNTIMNYKIRTGKYNASDT